MRGVLLFTLSVVVTAGYGPPSGGGCGGGCPGHQQPQPVHTSSCGGNGCGGGSTGSSSGGGGSDGYWWTGNNSPFAGPPAGHVSVGSNSGSSRPVARPQAPLVQRPQARPQPQQGYIQPRPVQAPIGLPLLPSSQNLVQPPMGICPASFVCIHWQLCPNGALITDGTGEIDKRIKEIPVQVSSSQQSCGGDMICCRVPTGTPVPQRPRPVVSQPQVLAPAPSPPRQVPQLPRPAPQPARPVNQPPRVAPQPTRPVNQPPRLAPQPPRPAPQPVRPVSRPVPPQSRPSSGYGNPQTSVSSHQRPQPNPQPTVVNPARPYSPPQPQPQVPISNPIGLVSPPSPQPNPMMGGMMMMPMGMPMRGGSCSAGTYCVQESMCNPYTGFIIRDPSQLMAVWFDAPRVPLIQCFVPGGGIPNGVCCQETHPNAGGFD